MRLIKKPRNLLQNLFLRQQALTVVSSDTAVKKYDLYKTIVVLHVSKVILFAQNWDINAHQIDALAGLSIRSKEL